MTAACCVLFAADAKLDDAKAKVKAGKYQEAITSLDAQYKAQPKNNDVRLALADAHYQYGNSMMNDAQMPPFRKYPGALREFRKTLEYDKDNKKAKDNIALIEGIYKSMAREVPK
jgi:tetratricopeptide (TPR) repeat protein